jgi:hypothetical protein
MNKSLRSRILLSTCALATVLGAGVVDSQEAWAMLKTPGSKTQAGTTTPPQSPRAQITPDTPLTHGANNSVLRGLLGEVRQKVESVINKEGAIGTDAIMNKALSKTGKTKHGQTPSLNQKFDEEIAKGTMSREDVDAALKRMKAILNEEKCPMIGGAKLSATILHRIDEALGIEKSKAAPSRSAPSRSGTSRETSPPSSEQNLPAASSAPSIAAAAAAVGMSTSASAPDIVPPLTPTKASIRRLYPNRADQAKRASFWRDAAVTLLKNLESHSNAVNEQELVNSIETLCKPKDAPYRSADEEVRDFISYVRRASAANSAGLVEQAKEEHNRWVKIANKFAMRQNAFGESDSSSSAAASLPLLPTAQQVQQKSVSEMGVLVYHPATGIHAAAEATTPSAADAKADRRFALHGEQNEQNIIAAHLGEKYGGRREGDDWVVKLTDAEYDYAKGLRANLTDGQIIDASGKVIRNITPQDLQAPTPLVVPAFVDTVPAPYSVTATTLLPLDISTSGTVSAPALSSAAAESSSASLVAMDASTSSLSEEASAPSATPSASATSVTFASAPASSSTAAAEASAEASSAAASVDIDALRANITIQLEAQEKSLSSRKAEVEKRKASLYQELSEIQSKSDEIGAIDRSYLSPSEAQALENEINSLMGDHNTRVEVLKIIDNLHNNLEKRLGDVANTLTLVGQATDHTQLQDIEHTHTAAQVHETQVLNALTHDLTTAEDKVKIPDLLAKLATTHQTYHTLMVRAQVKKLHAQQAAIATDEANLAQEVAAKRQELEDLRTNQPSLQAVAVQAETNFNQAFKAQEALADKKAQLKVALQQFEDEVSAAAAAGILDLSRDVTAEKKAFLDEMQETDGKLEAAMLQSADLDKQFAAAKRAADETDRLVKDVEQELQGLQNRGVNIEQAKQENLQKLAAFGKIDDITQQAQAAQDKVDEKIRQAKIEEVAAANTDEVLQAVESTYDALKTELDDTIRATTDPAQLAQLQKVNALLDEECKVLEEQVEAVEKQLGNLVSPTASKEDQDRIKAWTQYVHEKAKDQAAVLASELTDINNAVKRGDVETAAKLTNEVDHIVHTLKSEVFDKELQQAVAAPALVNGAQNATLAVVNNLTNTVFARTGAIRAARNDIGIATGDGAGVNQAIWMEFFGGSGKQGKVLNYDGSKSKVVGGTIGGDTNTEYGTIGLAFTYADSQVKGKSTQREKLDAKSYSLTGYGEYDMGDGFFLDALAGVSFQNYKTKRTVTAPIAQTLKSKSHGTAFTGELGLGRLIKFENGSDITPSVAVRYTHLKLGRGKDRGGATAMQVSYKNNNTTVGTFIGGVSLGHTIDNGSLKLRPEIHANLLHDFAAGKQRRISNISGAGAVGTGIVSNPTFNRPKTSYNVGGSLTLFSENNVSVALKGDMNFNNKKYKDYTGSLKVRYEF